MDERDKGTMEGKEEGAQEREGRRGRGAAPCCGCGGNRRLLGPTLLPPQISPLSPCLSTLARKVCMRACPRPFPPDGGFAQIIAQPPGSHHVQVHHLTSSVLQMEKNVICMAAWRTQGKALTDL